MTDPKTNYCESILGDNPQAMEAIRYIPEFSECSDDLLRMVYKYSKAVSLDPGETMIREGMFDQWVYFMILGELDVIIGDKKLGTTAGPVVGERCILGEPRGADLIAGEVGVMALGVEMTIIDAINRDINNFMAQTDNQAEIEAYREERMAISLELMLIILKDVARRIADIYQFGISGAEALGRSDDTIKIQVQTLFDFSEADPEENEADSGQTVKKIQLYSFKDFAEAVYYELLQKHMSEFGFTGFPLETWHQHFNIGEDGRIRISETFDCLKNEFKLSNDRLVDIALSIFEIASKYTAAANKSFNLVMSELASDEEKQAAMNSLSRNDFAERAQMADFIRQDLFEPIEAARKSADTSDDSEPGGKMSQTDIDALFG